jgi:hypothetical protein
MNQPAPVRRDPAPVPTAGRRIRRAREHLAMHLEGHLTELDINPLMVLPSGQGVKAVDALVVFRGT